MASKPIGTLREKSLHAALKLHYARKRDVIEAAVAGYQIDIKRGKHLIEIQTRSFSSIRPKLNKLLDEYKITLVHPIAVEKWILCYDTDGVLLHKRKSPKHGDVFDVFRELVSFPQLVLHKNFSLEVVLTHEEEILREDGRGSWRRKGRSIYDRKLIQVVRVQKFTSVRDWQNLLPAHLPATFTNQELAQALGKRRDVVQRMTYCLQRMGLLALTGKRGRAGVFVALP